MNIYEGDLSSLLSWFHLQTESDVLVLLVSTDEIASGQIQLLIQDVDRVDAALGVPVTMMLFGPKPLHPVLLRGDMGRVKAIGGDLVTRRHIRPRSLGWEVMQAEEAGSSALYSEAVRRATFRTMQDIIRVADIRRSQLPCLVVYLRSIERPFILGLQSSDKPEHLLLILREIASLHDEVMRIPRPTEFDVGALRHQVAGLDEANREIDAKIKKISGDLLSLQRKYKMPLDLTNGLIAGYRSLHFEDDLVGFLQQAIGAESPMLRDQRIPKILEMTKRLRLIQSQLKDFTAELRGGVQFTEQMAEVAARIEGMQDKVAKKVGASLGAWGVERTAANIDVWTSLAAKFAQAVELLAHLLPPS